MLINSQTKIAALLKHHPGALEAIVSLSPDFKKLRNPILRALMAGRTTIAMASKIGGCSPEDFFHVLKPYGFEGDSSPQESEEPVPEKKALPQYLQNLDPVNLVVLDVRAMLAEGNDPLKHIQQTVKGLRDSQVLKIVNTFEPTPLINLLGKQGYQSYTDFLDKDLVETYFSKTADVKNSEEASEMLQSEDWDFLLQKFKDQLREIDVRNLEMPKPMMTILEALESLPDNTALYVYHKRIPVYLLTELKERGCDYRIKNVGDNEVHLLIFKN